jgi:hypothetical protein
MSNEIAKYKQPKSILAITASGLVLLLLFVSARIRKGS